MITVSSGRDVAEFIAKIKKSAEQYSNVTFCSPFIGNEEAAIVADLIIEAPRAGCSVQVITSVHAGNLLRSLLPVEPSFARRRVIVSEGLHAKFYLAISRRPQFGEAIVTSANLTNAGLRTNHEFGVRAMGTSEAGRALVNRVAIYARQLAA